MSSFNNNHCEGAEWLELQSVELSDFGKRVADMVGYWLRGIYHIGREVMHERVEWSNKRFIQIVISGNLSYDNLTRLVMLSHSFCIRVEIGAAAPGYLRLFFSNGERSGDRDIFTHHPTVEEMVEKYFISYENDYTEKYDTELRRKDE